MKTFILFWNPSISSYTLDRLTDDIHWNALNDDFDWSIRDHQLAHTGDRFFMVRCKNKPVPGKLNQWGKQVWEPFFDDHTGICMSGTFTSEPFRGEDWSGKGREVFYMKMHIDVALNPDKMPILKSSDLIDAIPDFDWKGGASGRLIEEDKADTLSSMWELFCKNHIKEFKNGGNAAFIDEEQGGKAPANGCGDDNYENEGDIDIKYKESVFHIFGIPNDIDLEMLYKDAGKYCSDDGFSGLIKVLEKEDNDEEEKNDGRITSNLVLLGASTQGVGLAYFKEEKAHLHIDLPWLGSIGDVKLAFALMKQIKEQYPNAEIYYNDQANEGQFALIKENFDAMVIMRLTNMSTLIESSTGGTHAGAQGFNSMFIVPSPEDNPGKDIDDLVLEAMNTFISLQWDYSGIHRSGKANVKSPDGEEFVLRFLTNDEDTFVGVCQHVAMSGKDNEVKDILVKDFLKALEGSPYLEMVDAMQFVLKKMPQEEWEQLYNTVNGRIFN